MKRIFTLVISILALALPMIAQDSNGQSNPQPITLRSQPIRDKPVAPIHRAPTRISVEAWYETTTNTISIIYTGEEIGEAILYKDGELIDSSTEINTTFWLSESGFYTIEIVTDAWTVTGSIEI